MKFIFIKKITSLVFIGFLLLPLQSKAFKEVENSLCAAIIDNKEEDVRCLLEENKQLIISLDEDRYIKSFCQKALEEGVDLSIFKLLINFKFHCFYASSSLCDFACKVLHLMKTEALSFIVDNNFGLKPFQIINCYLKNEKYSKDCKIFEYFFNIYPNALYEGCGFQSDHFLNCLIKLNNSISIDFIEKFVDEKNINGVGTDDDSNLLHYPLFRAFEASRFDIVNLLIDKGADPRYLFKLTKWKLMPKDGYNTLLSYLIENNFINIDKIIQENEPLKDFILYAVEVGFFFLVKRLMQKGFDDELKSNGSKLLELAVKKNHSNLVTLFIQNKIDFDLKNNCKKLIEIARENKNEPLEEILLNNLVDDDDNTFLHRLVKTKDPTLKSIFYLKKALYSGVPLKARNKEGDTFFTLAVKEKRKDIINFFVNFNLISIGTRVDIIVMPDKDGIAPLQWAINKDRKLLKDIIPKKMTFMASLFYTEHEMRHIEKLVNKLNLTFKDSKRAKIQCFVPPFCRDLILKNALISS